MPDQEPDDGPPHGDNVERDEPPSHGEPDQPPHSSDEHSQDNREPDHSHHHAENGHDHHQHDDNSHHQHEDHDHHQHDLDALGVAIITVSSSRSLDEDPAGDAIGTAFEADGHEVVTRELLRDDYDSIQGTVKRLVDRDDTDVIVTTGGTGITPDDVTVEAIRPLLGKRLPGFGELFRALSRDEIGTRVVGTRATAGVVDDSLVFCLPGSENAARLGAQDVIVPEATHLAGLVQRDDDS